MIVKPIDLHAAVLSKYRSIKRFAEAAGWNYAKAYRIVTGEQDATVGQAREILRLLEVTDPADAVALFSMI